MEDRASMDAWISAIGIVTNSPSPVMMPLDVRINITDGYAASVPIEYVRLEYPGTIM